MKQGFTLIEIMIAVAIIAILAAIAIPSFAKYRGEAQEAVCKSQKNSIQIAAEHWLSKPANAEKVKNNEAPDLETDLVGTEGKGYFKEKPTCPCGGEYDITIDENTKAVEVTCSEHDDSGTSGSGTGSGTFPGGSGS